MKVQQELAGPIIERALTLDCCDSRQTVVIERIDEDDDDGCRLRELGLYEGAVVQVISASDPVVLAVFSNRIAICRRCARNVTVRLQGGPVK